MHEKYSVQSVFIPGAFDEAIICNDQLSIRLIWVLRIPKGVLLHTCISFCLTSKTDSSVA